MFNICTEVKSCVGNWFGNTIVHFNLQVCEVKKLAIIGKIRGRGCGKRKVVNGCCIKWPKADIPHSSELDRTQKEKEGGRKVKRRSPGK